MNPIVKGFPNGIADGGVHVHSLERENEKTKFDGAHTHLFALPDGSEVIATEEDGQHEHRLYSHDDYEHVAHDGEHVHRVKLEDGTELTTEIGGFHTHGLQVEVTAFDGDHEHKLLMPDGRILATISALTLWRMQGKPDQASNPPAPPASELARTAGATDSKAKKVAHGEILSSLRSFAVDKSVLVLQDGNLYVHATGSLKKSAESAIAQMIDPSAADGIKVMGGLPDLSRPHIAVADLVVKMHDEFVVTDASDAEAAHGGLPDVLTWAAVAAKRMPESGSGLPESLEDAIPAAYRYWKAGDRASDVRDALVESGFLTNGNVGIVNKRMTRIITKRYISPEQPDNEVEFARTQTFPEVISGIVKRACAMWSIEDAFPSAEDAKNFPDDCVIVLDPLVTKKWIDEGTETAESLTSKASALNLPILIVAPDSLGSRISFSRFGDPFTIDKCAAIDLVFVSNFDNKGVTSVAIEPAAIDNRCRFTLSQQVWKNGKQTVWHLLIDRSGDGLDGWTLQASPVDKNVVAGIRRSRAKKDLLDFDGSVGSGESVGSDQMNDSEEESEIWIADKGHVVTLDKTDDSMSVRFDGDSLHGVFTIEGRDADSIWKFQREQTKKSLAKSYQVGEFVVAKADKEERFVYGIVLEPETIDAQNDIYSADEVRDTAHKFMAEFQNIGIQHQELAKQVRILESFLAPADFTVGDRIIKAGTWLLAVRVLSDALWKEVKEGVFTGFSIGGTAIRRPA